MKNAQWEWYKIQNTASKNQREISAKFLHFWYVFDISQSYLLANHLPTEDLLDISLYCNYYSLNGLATHQAVGQLVIWREVFPTRRVQPTEPADHGYSEPQARWFLLIVGLVSILCMHLYSCSERFWKCLFWLVAPTLHLLGFSILIFHRSFSSHTWSSVDRGRVQYNIYIKLMRESDKYAENCCSFFIQACHCSE